MYRTTVAGGILLAATAVPLASAQTFVGRNFTASTFLLDSLRIPPDTMGAVGTDYFVELINGRYSVYRKSDGVRVQTSTLNQFWTSAGAAPTGASFDPRVIYDPHAKRFYACAVDNRLNPNNFLLAVSRTSDPTQGWAGFTIDSDTDNSNWADFPMLSYNAEGVFISSNMPTLGSAPTRTSFVVVPKVSLLSPVPSLANMTQIEDVALSTTGGTPQLAVDASNATGVNMPVLSMFNTAAGILQRTDITPPGAPVIANVGQINIPGANQPPTVDQPGPKQNLESNDSRFSGNTVLHQGNLWGVQSIESAGKAATRWFRIDVANNTVAESGIITHPDLAFIYPSIAINDFGDLVVGMTGASPNQFASSYAVVGRFDGVGTTFAAPLLLRAGVSDYEVLDSQNRNRWGDYSATVVDPADPGIFWTTQEYVSATDVWSTNVTELITLQPNQARWGEALPVGAFDDPTMWHTTHGGAPLPSDHVVFSRPTGPGPQSMSVFFPPQPPGVYVNESASFRQGNVFVDLLGSQWDLARQLEVGPYGGRPDVTIANGTVSSQLGLIANRPQSEARMHLNNATWNIFGELNVGGAPAAQGGSGALIIENNSRVNVLLALRVWPNGIVNYNSGSLTVGPLDVRSGGRIFMSPAGPSKTLRANFIDIAPGGLIDMSNNFMIIDYLGVSALPPVHVNLLSGYNNGAWNGLGINSSTAAAGVTHALGFAESSAIFTSFPAMFGGQMVDDTAILVRYTRYGDADLNGVVNLNDFNRLAANFGQVGKFWWEGDFTFNGIVNLDDFNRLAANFGLSASPGGPTPDDWAALASVVPEPMSLVIGLPFVLLLRRRSA